MDFDKIIQEVDSNRDYTIREVSEKLPEVSYSSILSNIARGHLPAKKLFGRYYVKGKFLRQFLAGEEIELDK